MTAMRHVCTVKVKLWPFCRPANDEVQGGNEVATRARAWPPNTQIGEKQQAHTTSKTRVNEACDDLNRSSRK